MTKIGITRGNLGNATPSFRGECSNTDGQSTIFRIFAISMEGYYAGQKQYTVFFYDSCADSTNISFWI